MRPFLLGVGSTLLVLLAAVVGLVLLVGTPATEDPPGDGASSGPSSSPSVTTAPEVPEDLRPGETWLGDVDLRSGDVVTRDGSLTDVVARGTGVRSGDGGLRAQRLDVDATVPFDVVAARVGGDARVFAAGDGRAGVERRVDVLGQRLAVRATGTVRAEGGEVVLDPETVDVGGPDLLDDALSALARRLVTIRQPVEAVPDGMRLTDVTVREDGLRVRLAGNDVTVEG